MVFGHPTTDVQKRIFVTGSPRSGTTFVGTMLACPPTVDYIHEPFNPECGMTGLAQQYIHPCEVNRNEIRRLLQALVRYDFTLKTGIYPGDSRSKVLIKRILGSRGPIFLRLAKTNIFRKVTVVKDPMGCLLTEILATEFGFVPVIMVRHPVSAVASLLRQSWNLQEQYASLLAQPALRRDFFQTQPELFPEMPSDRLELAARLWTLLNHMINVQRRRISNALVQTHESIIENPVQEFKRMFQLLELPWSWHAERRIAIFTNREAGGRRLGATGRSRAILSRTERRRVFDLTFEIAQEWYDKDSFDIG